jgi:release factor glutamine methyltransferase
VQSILETSGVVFAQQEVRWLLEAATGSPPARLVGTQIDEKTAGAVRALARRRATGEPLQYITGIAGFRHLELAVGPGVLIPRPETEMVVERALAHLPRGGVAIDVGTGSGAIALSIAHERPDAQVLATDISTDALAWAEMNRQRLNLSVEFIACDLLTGIPAQLRGNVDLVVSNPPYVPDTEARILPRDVVAHEPHEALFGGVDGLDIVRALADSARDWLTPKGWLVLEIAAGAGADVARELTRLGYESVAAGVDLAGRERVAEAQRD